MDSAPAQVGSTPTLGLKASNLRRVRNVSHGLLLVSTVLQTRASVMNLPKMTKVMRPNGGSTMRWCDLQLSPLGQQHNQDHSPDRQ
jgi:hypothetical protein